MNLFFTDIDGTLLREDHTVSDALRAGLKKLSDNGHGIVFSSGRPLKSILGVFDTLDVDFQKVYLIASNGSLIYDYKNKQSLYDIRFPLELVDEVQKVADQFNLHIQTYTQSEIVTPAFDKEIEFYTSHVKMKAICSPRLSDALTEAPFKMLAIDLDSHQNLLDFQSKIQELYSDKIQTMFSNEAFLELIHKDASKGNALQRLCQMLQVPIENSFAAGDSENDLSMLLAAGTSYAMANADEKIKSSAAFTTALDCNHDGVLEILEKHFF